MSLYDRLVPAEALSWGPMTVEPFAWHEDRLRYVWAFTQHQIIVPIVPTFEELGDVLGRIAWRWEQMLAVPHPWTAQTVPADPNPMPRLSLLPWRKRR